MVVESGNELSLSYVTFYEFRFKVVLVNSRFMNKIENTFLNEPVNKILLVDLLNKKNDLFKKKSLSKNKG